MSRRASPKAKTEAPAPKPWRAVVLAVDTAANSGWAVLVAGEVRAFGEVDTLDGEAVAYIVRWAGGVAAKASMPIALVLEAPWGGTVRTVASLGAARERWLLAWRTAEQPAMRVVTVMPSTWRSAVLGRFWASARREDVRPHEQRVAAALVGEDVDGDEAAALLIGVWASQAGAIGRVIGQRARLASMRAWMGKEPA